MVYAKCHSMSKNGLKWSLYGILSFMKKREKKEEREERKRRKEVQ